MARHSYHPVLLYKDHRQQVETAGQKEFDSITETPVPVSYPAPPREIPIPPPPPGLGLPPTVPATIPSTQEPTVPARPPPPPRSPSRKVLLLGLGIIILLALILASVEAVTLLTPKTTSHAIVRTATSAPPTATPTANSTFSAQQAAAQAAAYAATATAAVVALEQQYASATSKPPTFTDSLQDNSHGHAWSNGANSSGGKCQFAAGDYHAGVTPQQGSYFIECLATATNFNTFAYQVQLTVLKGDNVCTGLAFGSNASSGGDYYFDICQDGSYGLYLYYPPGGSNQLLKGINPMIHLHPNSPNVLALLFTSDTTAFYLNNRYLDSMGGLNAGPGPIGVIVYGVSSPTEVIFRDAKVWTV